jgi:hypothetical protein
MPMPPYRILCYEPGCGGDAVYKIAARWSDGVSHDLKTYGLTCEAHLPKWYERSLARQAACQRAANETLDPPGIYRLERGRRDGELERLTDLEAKLKGV